MEDYKLRDLRASHTLGWSETIIFFLLFFFCLPPCTANCTSFSSSRLNGNQRIAQLCLIDRGTGNIRAQGTSLK